VRDTFDLTKNKLNNGNNITRLERKLCTIQSGMTVSINNYNYYIIERYFKEMQEDIHRIKRALSR
jgi:hypothetical protein